MVPDSSPSTVTANFVGDTADAMAAALARDAALVKGGADVDTVHVGLYQLEVNTEDL